MMDQKFIDYFIEQSEKVAPGESEYWVVKSEENVSFKSTNSIVKPIIWNKTTIRNLAVTAGNFDRLILHSYFFSHLKDFFKILSKDIPVVWMFWGGDGYSFSANTKQWFLPLTWKWISDNRIKNVNFFRGRIRQMLFYKQDILQSWLTKRLIKRANICATWVKHDFEMVRHINPKMTFSYYSYFTYQQLVFSGLDSVAPDYDRLWLGNSATDTNNHLDAIQYLYDIKWPGKIIVPLSYGSRYYAECIISFGKKFFGDRFIPILDLLPLAEYQALMNSCGIVWMNHIRQQAAGNIIAALYLGKAVIMNTENNMFKSLRDMNIQFAEKEQLIALKNIMNQEFSGNAEIIRSFFSEEYIIDSLNKLYFDKQK